MSEEFSYDLSTVNQLFSVVQKRLGSTDLGEVQQVTDLIIGSISTHLDAGEQIAFIKRLNDGSIGLTTLSISFEDEE